MTIQWSTGNTRYVWLNGNFDADGVWDGLQMWMDRCGIVYTPAASLGQAQLIGVEPGEYSSAFGVSGFLGHNTTFVDDQTGLGVLSYFTIADSVPTDGGSPVDGTWSRTNVGAHEVWHADGAVDVTGSADTIMSYGSIHGGPSQSDTAAAIARYGANPNGTAFHAGGGSGGGISGGGGNDMIWGDAGNDILYGNTGSDSLDGGAESDTVYGGQDADTLSGGDAADVLYGNLAADLLDGGANADTLYGGQDADTLSGGAGSDMLFGNLGADRVVFGSGDGVDTIVGFSIAQDDVIAVAANANGTGVATAADLVARLSADGGGNAVLDLGTGHMVTLMGVPPASLSAADFLIV